MTKQNDYKRVVKSPTDTFFEETMTYFPNHTPEEALAIMNKFYGHINTTMPERA